MDKRFLTAGHLAVPLESNPEHPINPQPNFLIIERLGDKVIAGLPEPLGLTVCLNSLYHITFRQILPEDKNLGRMEEMTEFVYESANQPVPTWAVHPLSDYSALLENVVQINMLLSMFQFRGALQGFVLKVDEAVVQQIIDEK